MLEGGGERVCWRRVGGGGRQKVGVGGAYNLMAFTFSSSPRCLMSVWSVLSTWSTSGRVLTHALLFLTSSSTSHLSEIWPHPLLLLP
jgi:hypothetical protein